MDESFIIQHIRQMLTERGWSVYRLAKESGLPYTTLYNMFERETVPGFVTLDRIVQGFGITMAQFFAEGEYPDLTKRQRALLAGFDSLNEEKKQRMEAYLDGLLECAEKKH